MHLDSTKLRLIGFVAAAVLGVGACSADSPVPTQPAASTSTASPSTPNPVETHIAPTAPLLATPSPSTNTFTPFEAIEGFPGRGEAVTDIIATESGFIAVGRANQPLEDCPAGPEGRVWTSPDGRAWTVASTDFPRTSLEAVAMVGDSFFVFGETGDFCRDAATAANIWRSSSDGTWRLVARDVGSGIARWEQAVPVGETTVAFLSDWKSGRTVWFSANGRDWDYARGDTPTLHSGAAIGDNLVAFSYATSVVGTLAWYSDDAGATWSQGSIDSDYELYPHVVAADGHYLSPSTACCGLPRAEVGVVLESGDGRTWRAQAAALGMGARAAARVGEGFLALTGEGPTMVSADGSTWHVGPPGPPSRFMNRSFAEIAATDAGVVVTADEWADNQSIHPRAWFAPAEAFDPAAWTTPVEPAVMPEVGVPYHLSVTTHCGSSSMVVNVGGMAWGPSSIPNVQLDFNSEEGSFMLVDSSRATFTTTNGVAIPYVALHPPPPPYICY